MSIVNLIPEEEQELIRKYIAIYGPSYCGETNPNIYAGEINLDVVLDEWSSQKSKDLIKLMEGNLILRRPYTWVVNNDSLAYEIKKPAETFFCKNFIVVYFIGIFLFLH